MNRPLLSRLGRALAPAATAAILLAQPVAHAQDGERTPAPGEGVICAWAIYTVMNEVGPRCHPGEDAAIQAEVARAVEKIDAYVLANLTPTPTREDLDAFKRKQGHVGAPAEQLCTGSAEEMYEALVAQGPAPIRQSVDELLERPGEPTWGTCL